MEKDFFADGLSELHRRAEDINELIEDNKCDIVLFRGAMGAGKTTLIKELCVVRGVEDVVTSPTFALINEYKDKNEKTIFHFDFYRINTINEVLDLGYEEYFYGDGLCLVEWPEKIEELIPEDLVVATITIEQDGGKDCRKITFKCSTC
ncbi:MAG: tRNA (adenosine(37)-N6)-threonylcarbamoyltransferase complex ATPase subunit type 1 TsaE [Rikenellaceae bacterium]